MSHLDILHCSARQGLDCSCGQSPVNDECTSVLIDGGLINGRKPSLEGLMGTTFPLSSCWPAPGSEVGSDKALQVARSA